MRERSLSNGAVRVIVNSLSVNTPAEADIKHAPLFTLTTVGVESDSQKDWIVTFEERCSPVLDDEWVSW